MMVWDLALFNIDLLEVGFLDWVLKPCGWECWITLVMWDRVCVAGLIRTHATFVIICPLQ